MNEMEYFYKNRVMCVTWNLLLHDTIKCKETNSPQKAFSLTRRDKIVYYWEFHVSIVSDL